jgi:hypothetical protein
MHVPSRLLNLCWPPSLPTCRLEVCRKYYMQTRHNRFAKRLVNTNSCIVCTYIYMALTTHCQTGRMIDANEQSSTDKSLRRSRWHHTDNMNISDSECVRQKKLRGSLENMQCCGEWATLIIINLGHGTRHSKKCHTSWAGEVTLRAFCYKTISMARVSGGYLLHRSDRLTYFKNCTQQ